MAKAPKFLKPKRRDEYFGCPLCEWSTWQYRTANVLQQSFLRRLERMFKHHVRESHPDIKRQVSPIRSRPE
jgi:hypothetical protein